MATISSLECLTTMYSTTTCINDDIDNLDEICTTATGVATTLGTISGANITIIATNNYVESLSDEQLAKFDEMLKAKEDAFTLTDGYTVNQLEKSMQKVKSF